MEFTALDVETANADMASICQIGIARFRGGALVEDWKTYVDPEDHFDGINISIHGIDEAKVEGAPTLPEISERVCAYLDGRIAVCHTHFDRVAIVQAASKYELRTPACTWLDSARVARRTWDEFAWKGYGLENLCTMLGYQYVQHDALEDAKAAAQVILAAMQKTGLTLQDWLRRVEQPIDPSGASGHIAREGNPNGPFHGEVIVFTGALTIPRCEAAAMAAEVGFSVGAGVTKHATILVVGDQDIGRLAGHDKSSKHRKAEKMMQDGQAIRVLKEADFRQLVSCCKPALVQDVRCGM